MNTIEFKGTDTIGEILAACGKIKTNATKSFMLEISDLESALHLVAVPASATKEEKESALGILTPQERVTLETLQAKVSAHAKTLAKARVAGKTSERWVTRGNATLA